MFVQKLNPNLNGKLNILSLLTLKKLNFCYEKIFMHLGKFVMYDETSLRLKNAKIKNNSTKISSSRLFELKE